jgi:putative Holliday junction resolvase
MPEHAREPEAQPHLVLAFDYGRRRIGVACGDTLSRIAGPLTGMVHGDEPPWEAIGAVLREWRPSLLVVGLPYNADGSESGMSGLVRAFAAELAQRSGLPVNLVDERYSSLEGAERLKSARAAGLRKRRVGKADVDAAAACVILERWFDEST